MTGIVGLIRLGGLVRVRAAEFPGLAGAADPRPAIMDALRQTQDPFEASLISNPNASMLP
jgi:hypothetical protein